jgi:hypothetical protein
MLFELVQRVPHFKTKTDFMKRIFLALSLLFALGTSIRAFAQQPVPQPVTKETRTTFYYYPQSNIYYNPGSTEYWYYDDVSATWTQVKELPTTIVLTKTPRYTVYYNGSDVWKDNAEHMKKYKGKKGETKAKKDR